MADAIVRGEINNRNDAEFRASVQCSRRRPSRPSGSIRGEIDNRISYAFNSNRPTRIRTRRSGSTRYVSMNFSNARVRNRRTNATTTGATISLVARRRRNGRLTASLAIFRPRQATLRASGRLEDGRVTVSRQVSCRR